MKREDYKQWEPKLVPLPCPFCGKKPKLFPIDPDREGDAFGEVSCMNEKCSAHPTVRDCCEIADMRGPGAYKDLAIKRWNRRF